MIESEEPSTTSSTVTPETTSTGSFETSESLGEVWYRPPIPKTPPRNRAPRLQTSKGVHSQGDEPPFSPTAAESQLQSVRRDSDSLADGHKPEGEISATVKKKKSIQAIAAEYKKSVVGKTIKLLKRRAVSESDLDASQSELFLFRLCYLRLIILDMSVVTLIKWVRGELIGGDPSGVGVYVGLNVKTGEMMAVKQAEIPHLGNVNYGRSELLKQREAVRKLQREGELLAGLHHPNIVQYLSYEETNSICNLYVATTPFS